MKESRVKKTVADLRDFYDRLATKMGENWQESMYRAPHQRERFDATLEFLNTVSSKTKNVLELGSANGKMTAHLSRMFGAVDAVEISSVAISNSPVMENVTHICSDVEHFLRETQNTYDVIVATEVLEHVLDFNVTLNLCLEKGRLVIVSMPISEDINENGAFNPNLVGKEIQVGDATGHLRIITQEELESFFDEVVFSWNNGVSTIVVGRHT